MKIYDKQNNVTYSFIILDYSKYDPNFKSGIDVKELCKGLKMLNNLSK